MKSLGSLVRVNKGPIGRCSVSVLFGGLSGNSWKKTISNWTCQILEKLMLENIIKNRLAKSKKKKKN